MSGRVEIFKGDGKILPGYFFRVVSSNGQRITVSESYTVAWSARRQARKVAESLGVPLRDLSKPPYRKFP